jgi:hypothetical protein
MLSKKTNFLSQTSKYHTFVCSRDKEREGEFDVRINTKAFFLLIRTFITIDYVLAKCGFYKAPMLSFLLLLAACMPSLFVFVNQ